eukprot:1035137-Prymnesium_polylepis.1
MRVLQDQRPPRHARCQHMEHVTAPREPNVVVVGGACCAVFDPRPQRGSLQHGCSCTAVKHKVRNGIYECGKSDNPSLQFATGWTE